MFHFVEFFCRSFSSLGITSVSPASTVTRGWTLPILATGVVKSSAKVSPLRLKEDICKFQKNTLLTYELKITTLMLAVGDAETHAHFQSYITLKTPSKLSIRLQRCRHFSDFQNNKIQLNTIIGSI